LREPRAAQAAQGVPANVAESSEYQACPAQLLEQPEPQASAAERSAPRDAAESRVLLPAQEAAGARPGEQSAQAQPLYPRRRAWKF